MAKNKKGWLDSYKYGGEAGYTDIPFNYNSAWGGQFQTGGNLPGSTGMMYARTNSPAPSEGLYAKKTLPSAEYGMSFYQHGLDWKPKNISKNGLDIPKNQNAEFVLPRYDMPRAASESTAITLQTPKGKKSTATTGQKKEDIKAATEAMGKGKKREKEEEKERVAERKSAVAAKDQGKPFTLPSGETKKYEDMDAREKMYVSGKALEQRGRFNENEEAWYDEYANPLSWVGSMAGGLAEAPYTAKQTDSNLPYITAIGAPVVAGALGFDPLGGAMKVPGKIAQSMESGVLSNTYKLNPFAEKLANPSKSYRVAGMDAAADFQNTGVLRSNPTIVPTNLSEGILGTRTTPFPSFQKGYADLRYLPEEGGVVFETDLPTFKRGEINPVTGNKIRGSHYAHRAIDPNTGKVLTEIPGENVRMFEGKPNWLRGYKEVPIPSTGSGIVENKVLPKISTEQWKDMSGYLGRRQFLKGLQKEGLVGKEFNLGDVNYAARSTDKTNALTKLALDRYRTGYRGVQGDIGTGIGTQDGTNMYFNMNKPGYGNTISEVDNMINAGVDFTNPQSIAEYQATHIPMETYGYRSGIPTMYKADALYTSEVPNNYGKYQFRIKRPTDFSQGNYENWFNKYYKEQPKFEGEVWQNLVNKDLAPSETINYGKNIWIDTKGKKIANIDESFPFTDHKNLTPEQQIQYKKYQDDLIKNFNTGWRGQYKKGGVIKDNRGQWDHPGEITEIDSNNITMQGVPYPVLGIGKDGQQIMMQPGQDYRFNEGPVTEYPLTKKVSKKSTGGWLSQYK